VLPKKKQLTLRLGSFLPIGELEFVTFSGRPNLMKCPPTLNQWKISEKPQPVVVIPEDHLPCSGSGKRYSACFILICVDRRPTWYIWNVMFPMLLVTLMVGVAFSFPPDDLSSRIETLLTLFLTAIAFKLVVTVDIPRLSCKWSQNIAHGMCFNTSILQFCLYAMGYTDLTFMDYYFLACNSLMGAAVIAAVSADNLGEDTDVENYHRLEKWMCGIFVASWFMFHLVLCVAGELGWVHPKWKDIRRRFNAQYKLPRDEVSQSKDVSKGKDLLLTNITEREQKATKKSVV
jgi:hypothetical protein